jgi:hypothetical protein
VARLSAFRYACRSARKRWAKRNGSIEDTTMEQVAIGNSPLRIGRLVFGGNAIQLEPAIGHYDKRLAETAMLFGDADHHFVAGHRVGRLPEAAIIREPVH